MQDLSFIINERAGSDFWISRSAQFYCLETNRTDLWKTILKKGHDLYNRVCYKVLKIRIKSWPQSLFSTHEIFNRKWLSNLPIKEKKALGMDLSSWWSSLVIFLLMANGYAIRGSESDCEGFGIWDKLRSPLILF